MITSSTGWCQVFQNADQVARAGKDVGRNSGAYGLPRRGAVANRILGRHLFYAIQDVVHLFAPLEGRRRGITKGRYHGGTSSE